MLYVSLLLDEMTEDVVTAGVKFETRTEYAIEYPEQILELYRKTLNIDVKAFVSGRGHRKNLYQKKYQLPEEYIRRLKKYAESIEICGEHRNSYSKTDHGATFMRVKTE